MSEIGALAQRRFQSHVAQAIGKRGDHAVVTDADTRLVTFTVEETYALYTCTTKNRYSGIASHRDDDNWVTENESAYTAKIDKEIQHLGTDPGVFMVCEAEIRDTAYRKHAPSGSVFTMYATARRFMNHYGCSKCGKAGEVHCFSCTFGRQRCNACGGEGRVRCSSCGGRGSINQTRTVYSNNSSQVVHYQERCASCNGGYKSCYTCNSSGKITCSSCNGTTRVSCGPCDASGWFTDIAYVTLDAKYTCSRYRQKDAAIEADLDAFVEKIGFAGIPDEATFKQLNVVGDRDAMTIDARRAYEVPRVVYEATIGDQSAQIRHFGNEARIIDTGGILDHILTESRETFIKEVACARNMDDLSAGLMRIMTSGVARQIVSAAYPGNPDAESIHLATHQSSSVESIEAIMSGVRTAIGRMRRHYITHALLYLWALSPCVSFILIYMGFLGFWPAFMCATVIAVLAFSICAFRLYNRVMAVIPAANLLNRQEHGDEAIEHSGNPLYDFAESAGLLMTSLLKASLVGISLMLIYGAGSYAKLKNEQFIMHRQYEAVHPAGSSSSNAAGGGSGFLSPAPTALHNLHRR